MTELQTINDEIRDVRIAIQDFAITVSDDRAWERFREHVQVHKYLLQRELPVRVSWDDALFSWYENVFVPMMRAVQTWEVRSAFPRQTNGDLFLGITDHWHYLKERNPETTAEAAAGSFVRTYGTGIARFFSRFIVTA